VLIQGVLFIVAGALLFVTTKQLTSRPVLSAIAGLFLAAFGVSTVFAGLFPLPDPRHSGYGIALLVFLVPWILAWAIWRIPSSGIVRIAYLMATPIIFLTGIWRQTGFVSEDAIGLAQRIGAVVFFVWFIWTCFWVRARIQTTMS